MHKSIRVGGRAPVRARARPTSGALIGGAPGGAGAAERDGRQGAIGIHLTRAPTGAAKWGRRPGGRQGGRLARRPGGAALWGGRSGRNEFNFALHYHSLCCSDNSNQRPATIFGLPSFCARGPQFRLGAPPIARPTRHFTDCPLLSGAGPAGLVGQGPVMRRARARLHSDSLDRLISSHQPDAPAGAHFRAGLRAGRGARRARRQGAHWGAPSSDASCHYKRITLQSKLMSLVWCVGRALPGAAGPPGRAGGQLRVIGANWPAGRHWRRAPPRGRPRAPPRPEAN